MEDIIDLRQRNRNKLIMIIFIGLIVAIVIFLIFELYAANLLVVMGIVLGIGLIFSCIVGSTILFITILILSMGTFFYRAYRLVTKKEKINFLKTLKESFSEVIDGFC